MAEDIGFLRPDDTSKFVGDDWVLDGRVMIWLNPERFMDRVELFQREPDVPPVAPFLWKCLLGSARDWYGSELTEKDRAELADETTGLEQWRMRLVKRFRVNRLAAHQELDSARSKYLIANIVRGEDIRNWGARISRLARAAGYPDGLIPELLYERLDPSIQVTIDPPTAIRTAMSSSRDYTDGTMRGTQTRRQEPGCPSHGRSTVHIDPSVMETSRGLHSGRRAALLYGRTRAAKRRCGIHHRTEGLPDSLRIARRTRHRRRTRQMHIVSGS